MNFTLDALYQRLQQRAQEAPESSYTASLLAAGLPKIARKCGEEAVELAVAVLSGTREEVISESADLLYHWLVLLIAQGIPLEEVWEVLAKRQGMSGLEEKASR